MDWKPAGQKKGGETWRAFFIAHFYHFSARCLVDTWHLTSRYLRAADHQNKCLTRVSLALRETKQRTLPSLDPTQSKKKKKTCWHLVGLRWGEKRSAENEFTSLTYSSGPAVWDGSDPFPPPLLASSFCWDRCQCLYWFVSSYGIGYSFLNASVAGPVSIQNGIE